MRRDTTIHPIGCTCPNCNGPTRTRTRAAARTITRALLLIAAICAIPFIVAWAFASASGNR
ncbi:hypothetical protein GRI97_15690 [Altererythrobacter xixiisoli]|uniref:LITAF domain-containing protein n=1 Tax=Croceibacterium xixiisoli TaxID=1476466 RepID=A0A6I4U196_9SPHN|nr:LITAF-like zinc ribbon domain-containing protein [Croceibacterium xixiisoli]MXP00434.1 hypothetical protein [Croceibacterium xixiisoli]